MKMQKSLVLALGAGAAVSSVAMAQTEIPTLPIGPKVNLGGTFGDRAIVPVYNAIYDECPSSPTRRSATERLPTQWRMSRSSPGPWGNDVRGSPATSSK